MSARTIKAIDTRYRRRLFRSRIEARWAVFFDWARVKWEYEEAGYVVSGKPYLPDFWLPGLGMFFEVKGGEPEHAEVELARKLRDATGRASAIFGGLPGSGTGCLFCWKNGRPFDSWCVSLATDEGDKDLHIAVHGPNFRWFLHTLNSEERYYEMSAESTPGSGMMLYHGHGESKWSWFEPWLQRAVSAAAEARFEHGANPAPPWLD